MIKKQQKWVALLVTLTFAWLLQFSALPLNAKETNEQIASTSLEPGPGFHEVTKNNAPPARKKSILPYVLIGAGAVAVTVVLFLVVFKTRYDITGTWSVHITYDGNYSDWDTTVVLSGDKKSGIAVESNGGSGTYTVDGRDITVALHWPSGETIDCTGKIESNDRMSGRFVESVYWQGNWTAVRIASGASAPVLKQPASGPVPHK
jgi:hypothetical protein